MPRLIWGGGSDIRTFSIGMLHIPVKGVGIHLHITCQGLRIQLHITCQTLPPSVGKESISGNALIRRQFTFFVYMSCISEIAVSHFKICLQNACGVFSRADNILWPIPGYVCKIWRFARIPRTLRIQLSFFIRLISPLMIRSLIAQLINDRIITSRNWVRTSSIATCDDSFTNQFVHEFQIQRWRFFENFFCNLSSNSCPRWLISRSDDWKIR
jgi:hypothetical protein